MIEHNYVAHEREGWSVCTRCGMVRNYDRPIAGCRGVMGNIAVRGGMTMTVVEEETDTPICSVCARPTGFGDEDRGEPPVNLARCPAPGGTECRAVAQAVAPWRRENETLRSNCDHLSSENASLASQNESMAMRIESLADELAKPEDVRLREVLDALDGRAVIFDGLGARVGHLLDEMDEWIERAGEAERVQARVSGRRIMSSCRATNAKVEARAGSGAGSGVPLSPPYGERVRRPLRTSRRIVTARSLACEGPKQARSALGHFDGPWTVPGRPSVPSFSSLLQ